jgi:hypothetical protein
MDRPDKPGDDEKGWQRRPAPLLHMNSTTRSRERRTLCMALP